MIIQAIPYLTSPPTKIIVASPLNVIINDQSNLFKQDAILVDDTFLLALKSNTNSDPRVLRFHSNNFIYLLGHPECLTNPLFTQRLHSNNTTISHVVVDEAHCVLSYGSTLFRPSFLELKHIRCFFPGCKVVALTATASHNTQLQIISQLAMQKTTTIHLPPDRTNIFIRVLPRPPTTGGTHTVEHSYDAILGPVLDKLLEEQHSYPKTIIYLPLKWCAHAHKQACIKLGVALEGSDRMDTTGQLSSLFAQYHAPQGKKVLINDDLYSKATFKFAKSHVLHYWNISSTSNVPNKLSPRSFTQYI